MARREFATSDYFKITIFGFGLGAFWSCLRSIVLPVLLLGFVPEAMKNTYLSYVTFAGLVIAMVVQPIIGGISDGSRFSWGRRRPFILIGSLTAIFFLPGVGLSPGFSILLFTWCLLQFATNIAQGAYQGFIPDLVPENRRGSASGVKTMMEMVGTFILLSLVASFMDRYSLEHPGWLWVALGAVAIFLAVPTAVTVITVAEEPGVGVTGMPLLSSLKRSFSINLEQKRGFIWFLISRGLIAIPIAALQTYAVYYVMDVLGMPNPAGITAKALIAVGVGLTIAAYFAGRLSDRLGRQPILIASGFIGAFGILLLFLTKTQLHLMLSGAVIGIASGAYLSTSWALATAALPRSEASRYLGITNIAWVSGSLLAKLNGPLIDYFNTISHNIGYFIMLLNLGVCFLASSIILSKVKLLK